MPVDFRISDLPTSISFNNLDLMEVSQVDSQSPSGYSSVKKTMEEIGEKLLNDIQYSSALATTNKKIIPAINEVNSAIPANSDFSLSGLSDTTITTPSSGQVLSYDGGKWKNVGKVEVTSQATFTENITGTNTRLYTKAGVLYIFYQGESKTHNTQDTLFTLPNGLRPPNLLYTSFVINSSGYGTIEMTTAGVVRITNITGGENTGRVYFSCAIPLV